MIIESFNSHLQEFSTSQVHKKHHKNNFISVMVKSEMAIEEGSPLRIECTLDAILTDLKYKRINDKKLRNIFTKTAKKEKMIYYTIYYTGKVLV